MTRNSFTSKLSIYAPKAPAGAFPFDIAQVVHLTNYSPRRPTPFYTLEEANGILKQWLTRPGGKKSWEKRMMAANSFLVASLSGLVLREVREGDEVYFKIESNRDFAKILPAPDQPERTNNINALTMENLSPDAKELVATLTEMLGDSNTPEPTEDKEKEKAAKEEDGTSYLSSYTRALTIPLRLDIEREEAQHVIDLESFSLPEKSKNYKTLVYSYNKLLFRLEAKLPR